MNKVIRPPNATPIWGRSGAAMALILIAVKEVLPEAPWWGLALIALGALAVEQLVRPSQKADG